MSAPAAYRGVAPSILAADWSQLGAQVDLVLQAGATAIHVDVMDGHFVPPISMGVYVAEALAERVHAAGAVLDVHLMVERPERHVEAYAKAGADVISVHLEATPHPHYALQAVRDAGAAAGIALNPGTDPAPLALLAEQVDAVLCMTVNPGWGGQSFIEASVQQVARVRELLGPDVPIQVDGGIGPGGSAGACAEAGATVFVAGSSVFRAEDPAAAVRAIVEEVEQAVP